MSGEKKRLEQFLLQSRASNIVLVDPRFRAFQPDQIDTIRLRSAQIEAGKQPQGVPSAISETLKKQQQKKKKKARRGKQLRGEVGRAIREQKRFERGERRDQDTQEPRIVGEPRNTGLGYDPDIERRRLDIQEQRLRDENLRVLAQARRDQAAQERELAVRRGELAAARAERRLERERLAALPPPAPIVIPPAPAPNIRIEAPPPAQVDIGGIRVEPAQVDIGGIAPVINIPELPARADADPIPEIQRLAGLIREDVNAFGEDQRDRNEDLLSQVRRQARRQGELEARQVVIDEEQRRNTLAQDAQLQEFQARLGLQETAMGEARDAVIREINDAEGRLRQAAGELDRPVNYDEVILRAAQEELEEGTQPRRVPIEEVTPTPREPEPEEPAGIAAIIQGGGELNLPNVVIERPSNIGPDESLRLSPEDPGDRPGSIVERINPQTGRPFRIQKRAGTAGPSGRKAGGGGALRAPPTTPRQGTSAERELAEQGAPSAELESPDPTPEARPPSPELQLEEFEPVNVADELRASRLQLPDELPQSRASQRAQERIEAGAELPGDPNRLRLVDEQDFLAGFDRPQEQSPAERLAELLSPRRQAQQTDQELQALLAQEPPTPTPTPRVRTPEVETPSTREEEELLAQQAEIIEERQRERGVVDEEPLQPVAQGIAQFGGALQPAPPRVIEDAGIEAQGVPSAVEPQRQLRPLDPDVLFEPIEEAEEVGQVQDQRPQAIRDSATLFGNSVADLASQVRTGPRGKRGQKGGLGYRVRNNTDRTLKRVQPGDVVNVIGVEQGASGEGRYRLDTQTQAGTRVGLDQLQALIDDGSFIFEPGHRHELGGHFDENPYGPEQEEQEPGLLQQGAEAVGGVLAAGAGGAARLAGGVAQGVGEGIVEQLPAAGDIGAALGRGAVAGVAGAGRLAAGAAGAVGEAVFGGEEEELEPEPSP